VGWAVENYGTDPEIEVDNAPQDTVRQQDRQLETALATALQKIAGAPGTEPTFGARPNIARGPLPPR
jgi:tricorn protease